jgi:hypothetical protein
MHNFSISAWQRARVGWMSRWLQAAFFLLLVRSFLALILGVNLRHAERQPKTSHDPCHCTAVIDISFKIYP